MNSKPAHTSGVIAWLENTRVTLPLKGVEATFDVRGDLVSVELCQIYHQNHAQPLDVLYTFPLPAGAAVFRCEMIVNDRVISAKVMELQEARKVAAEKKAAGHRTALVESVRENLFELALGNLAPGDTVVVRIAWFQTLDTAGHDRSFRIPFTPGVRYIPGTPLLRSNTGKGTVSDTDQVPDASRLTPPRLDQFHPDAAWVSVEGRIQLEGVDAATIASPSHTLVLRESDSAITSRLGGTGEVPDRDFVLRLPASAPSVLTPAAWVTQENGHHHALVRIIAPVTAPATQTARDVYFLVDRSGSMEGEKWIATCRAFRAFLGNLAPQDRAWVTFFETQFRDLAEKPLPPAAILAEPAVQNLEALGADGGTNLVPALEHVLQALQRHSSKRSPAIVLITDGQVGNEEAILRRMKERPEVRVFCYGIDTAVNDAFLRRLAAQQRGACFLTTPREDLVGVIASLAARLRHPVFTDLRPPDGWELPGGSIPDLHAGECVSIVLRGPAKGEETALDFSAKDATGAPAVLPCPARVVTEPAISRLWAKERIELLLAEGNDRAAIVLSISANVVCQGTAFVAWDEKERIAVTSPNREVYPPAMGGSPSAGFTRGLQRMQAVATAMSADLCREPTAEELSEECGIDRAKLAQLKSAARAAAAPLGPMSEKDYFHDGQFFECKVANFDGDDFSYRETKRAATPGRLVQRKSGEPWRALLSSLSNIKLPDDFLDWLEHWLLSDPAKVTARRKLLEDLAGTLVSHPTPMEALVAWLNANLEPVFLGPALQELAAATPRGPALHL